MWRSPERPASPPSPSWRTCRGPQLTTLPLTVTPPGQAQVRARAWVRGVPLVRVRPGASIRRADVELDVDAESYGEDGAYLWGAALSGADVGLPQGYRAFVTWAQLPSRRAGRRCSATSSAT